MDLGDVSSLLSGGCSQESHCTSQHLASSSGSWFSSSPVGRKEGSRRRGQQDTEDEAAEEASPGAHNCGMGTPENQDTQTAPGTGPSVFVSLHTSARQAQGPPNPAHSSSIFPPCSNPSPAAPSMLYLSVRGRTFTSWAEMLLCPPLTPYPLPLGFPCFGIRTRFHPAPPPTPPQQAFQTWEVACKFLRAHHHPHPVPGVSPALLTRTDEARQTSIDQLVIVW